MRVDLFQELLNAIYIDIYGLHRWYSVRGGIGNLSMSQSESLVKILVYWAFRICARSYALAVSVPASFCGATPTQSRLKVLRTSIIFCCTLHFLYIGLLR